MHSWVDPTASARPLSALPGWCSPGMNSIYSDSWTSLSMGELKFQLEVPNLSAVVQLLHFFFITFWQCFSSLDIACEISLSTSLNTQMNFCLLCYCKLFNLLICHRSCCSKWSILHGFWGLFVKPNQTFVLTIWVVGCLSCFLQYVPFSLNQCKYLRLFCMSSCQFQM